MPELQITTIEKPSVEILFTGGIFLDDSLPSSIIKTLPWKKLDSHDPYNSISNHRKPLFNFSAVRGGRFLCTSLSIGKRNEFIQNSSSSECLEFNGDKTSFGEAALGSIQDGAVKETEKKRDAKFGRRRGGGAVNTTKHLWAGAVAAMVSRSVLIPILLGIFLLLVF